MSAEARERGTRSVRMLGVASVGLLAVQTALYYPKLPAQVIAQFGRGGQANSLMAKPVFFTMYAALLLGSAALFIALPRLIRKLPGAFVSLPNADYWLAPERRDETIGVLAEYMASLGVGVVVFLAGTFELLFRGNLATPPARLPVPFWFVAAFSGYVIIWMGLLSKRFQRPGQ